MDIIIPFDTISYLCGCAINVCSLVQPNQIDKFGLKIFVYYLTFINKFSGTILMLNKSQKRGLHRNERNIRS